MRNFTKLLLAAAALLAAAGPASAQTFRVGQLSDDSGPCASEATCSLREAVIAANANPGADTILLADGTHTLSIPAPGEGGATTDTAGDLDITRPVNISPAGSGRVTISAAGLGSRALTVAGAGVILQRLTIRGGTEPAADGGGLLVSMAGSSLRLDRVTVTGNSAGAGGAVSVGADGTLQVVASTISGNQATGLGGAIAVADPATVRVAGSTITANTGNSDAAGGGGAGGISAQAASTVTLRDSIVAGNLQLSPSSAAFGADCEAAAGVAFTSGGHNLVGRGSGDECPAGTGDIGGAPLLGPLDSNGGTTDTHALLAGSPAIDAGNPAGCRETDGAPIVELDQRLVPRQGRCDIGAFEAQPDLVVESMAEAADPVAPGADEAYTVTVRNQGAGPAAAAQLGLAVPDGVARVAASGPAGACGALDACALGAIPPGGAAAATFTVRPSAEGSITVAALVTVAEPVRETSIANNTRSETTTVQAPAPAPAPAPPPAAPPDTGTPPANTPPAVAVPALGAPVVTAGGRVRVRVGCPRGAPRPRCSGALRLDVKAARPRRPRVVLARARYSVARGRSVTVTLSLTAAGRRELARRGTLAARLVATPDGRGARSLTRAVRLTSGA